MASAAGPNLPNDGGISLGDGASSAPTTAPTGAAPTATDPFASQTARVNADRAELQPRNTKKAYKTVKAEFMGFCDAIFPTEPLPRRHLLSEPKLFGYLFYHAYRQKRPHNQTWGGFKLEDYNATIQRHPPTRESVQNDFADQSWSYCQYASIERQVNGLSELCAEQQHDHGTAVPDFCL